MPVKDRLAYHLLDTIRTIVYLDMWQGLPVSIITGILGELLGDGQVLQRHLPIQQGHAQPLQVLLQSKWELKPVKSGIFSDCGSGSRVLMTKNLKKSTAGTLFLVFFSMLRIRDVYPGSDFFHPASPIPDPELFHLGSRIRIKEFKYFKLKKSKL